MSLSFHLCVVSALVVTYFAPSVVVVVVVAEVFVSEWVVQRFIRGVGERQLVEYSS